MRYVCTSPSTITPFTLEEVKDHLRQTSSDDDFYIQQLIDVVISAAENITRRALYTSTWKLYLDAFCGEVYLPMAAPLQSVTHVKYYDTGGTLTTLDSDDYQVDAIGAPARISPAPTLAWPSIQFGRYNAIEIEYVAGRTKRHDLPPALKQAMLYHISHLYDVREPVVIGTIIANIPHTLMSLYSPYRVLRFF